MNDNHSTIRRMLVAALQPVTKFTALTCAIAAGCLAVHAAEFPLSVTHTRDGNSVEISQEWHAETICKRWTFEYNSSGAAPNCTFIHDFELHKSVYNPDTGAWSGWALEESLHSATSAAGTRPQMVTHTWTDEYGASGTGNPTELSDGHCPGLTIFQREVADYGAGNPIPEWANQVTKAATDKWVHDPGRWVNSVSVTYDLEGNPVFILPTQVWVATWPVGAFLQVASNPDHGYTHYITETGPWLWNNYPVFGVIWDFHTPMFTREYETFSGAPAPGPYTVTLTAPTGTKPYYRTYNPSYTVLCTIPD